MKLTEKEQQYLLKLARKAMVEFFYRGEKVKIGLSEVPSENLKKKTACFITLTLEGKLRGCIGHIVPIQPLYQAVIDNALSAAYDDPRFFPLCEDELQKVKIEISVLSLPEQIVASSPAERLEKIVPGQHGVIIQQNGRHATFLPQVWEKIPDKQDFLSQLCLKAGLPPTCWQDPQTKIFVYQVQKFQEE